MKLLDFIKSIFTKKKLPVENTGQTIKFGWVKDKPDTRDYKYTVVAPKVLPPLVDLRPLFPPVYDQGELGSCTANSLAGAYQFGQIKQKEKSFIPSRLFIYYNERVLENSVSQDAGAMIRDGIKTLVTNGVCPETTWKYSISKFAKKPSATAYKLALNNQVKQYLKVTEQSLYDFKYCLSQGYPIAFGFTVYESMMTNTVANSGIVPMPKNGEKILGGHAVLAVGYDDSKKALIVRNSWGSEWGINGYFYLPYGFITTKGLANDFWTIRLVE
jgi:C1A family cysteine protease